MTTRSPRVLGLMSGTSADGIDAVLLELPRWPNLGEGGAPPPLSRSVPRARVLGHVFTPYADDVRSLVVRAMRDDLRTSELAQLHFLLGEEFARAASPLAADADLVASHGQTVYHIPSLDEARGWRTRATLQLGEAAVIAARLGKLVVADFRPADLALGGQAAPLVPFADRVLYAQADVRRSLHNLGGISNLTYLPSLDAAGVRAFDTGPANCLIDEVAERTGRRFDDGGRLAASGVVHEELVRTWLRDPYFDAAPPKSTGREYWHLSRFDAPGLSLPDLAATVTAFTARSIADAYERFVVPLGLDEVVVAGGGARNPVLMGALKTLLSPLPVATFEERGWNSSVREAAAFAVLGYFAAQGWPNVLAHTTGASRAAVAGKITRPPE
ncbi:anhydro-N-acetylmuramic acid kinase [Deinococcus yavapaiensis]|uniref:Anhydro-N-acetylmuramic acid kinase n=1 Tax=Deinococcus yavapaiensis KR-236 TaxID=694435 RepID=A0A318SBN8_9DEIO|nr:anhydro-N-acetylmuramic acid kinase [Deinococcus yavapaiensis]PYE54157.1 anhydro-N-acetylmuramic acid kinase [Deinococcus yavapaiensis KR-236]